MACSKSISRTIGRIYMHTAKRKDAIETTTEDEGDCKHKNSLLSTTIWLMFVCRQRRHKARVYTACVNAKQ